MNELMVVAKTFSHWGVFVDPILEGLNVYVRGTITCSSVPVQEICHVVQSTIEKNLYLIFKWLYL